MLPGAGSETVADLEEHAFKRDRSFLGKLAVTLVLAVAASTVIYVQLTSSSNAGCAARAYLGEPETADPPSP